AWLRARPDVDLKHVGLLGHSEGGLIAPIVASRDKGVAFVVLLAGTGLRGDQIVLKQTVLIERSMGVGEPEIAATTASQQKVFAILASNDDEATARKKIDALLAPLPAAKRQETEGQLPLMLSRWYREFLRLDPAPYLRQLTAPVLALNGSRDLQVPPAEDLAAIRAALAGNHDVTVEELPGLNHLFQTCKSCTLLEYGDLEETMSPAALTHVTDWVQK